MSTNATLKATETLTQPWPEVSRVYRKFINNKPLIWLLLTFWQSLLPSSEDCPLGDAAADCNVNDTVIKLKVVLLMNLCKLLSHHFNVRVYSKTVKPTIMMISFSLVCTVVIILIIISIIISICSIVLLISFIIVILIIITTRILQLQQ